MGALLVSTSIVALAEIGDKTQLLAFVLAAKFHRPTPIVLGILVATLANHAFAGAVGSWVTALMEPQILQWVLGASFKCAGRAARRSACRPAACPARSPDRCSNLRDSRRSDAAGSRSIAQPVNDHMPTR